MREALVTLRRVPMRMHLPPHCERVTPMIRRLREWEPSSTQWILGSIRRGDTFVDVGAHAGYFTLLASCAVGPTGRVFAFEPDPTNFDYLTRNIQENGLRNVVAERRAVADENGTRKLYLSPTNTGDHRLSEAASRPSITVDCVPLDGYLRESGIDRVDFVKVDTQGAEVLVLAGMWETLRANPKVKLIIEFWPYGLTQLGETGESLLQQLRADGFPLSMSECKALLGRCTVENRKHVNLMLSRDRFEAPS